MGGTILEFSADKYFEAGKAEGRAEGKAEGEQKLATLLRALIADGKSEDVARAATDKEYRDSLYKKYAIV